MSVDDMNAAHRELWDKITSDHSRSFKKARRTLGDTELRNLLLGELVDSRVLHLKFLETYPSEDEMRESKLRFGRSQQEVISTLRKAGVPKRMINNLQLYGTRRAIEEIAAGRG